MAATSDAATDRVSRTTAPSLAGVTFCCWARINATHAGNLFHPMIRVEASGGTAAIFSFRGTNGRTPTLYSSSSTAGISTAEQALSTWVFLAFTMNSGPAQVFAGTTPGTLTKTTGTVNTSGTPDTITLFSRSPSDGSEWLEGSLAYVRMWTGVLSDAELAAESASATPVRTSGLWASWPLAAAALSDTSGNSRPLSAGSTALTAGTDPPLGTPTDAGTATLTLGASGTQSRVATAAGTAGLTLGATGTASAQRAAAGTAGLTLSAAGSSSHLATDAGSAALTLGADGTHARVATGAGLAGLVLGGDGTALHVATDAGTAALTLLAAGTIDSGAAVDAGAAVLTLGASGVHTVRRNDAGAAPLALGAQGTAAAVRAAAGAAVLELFADGVVGGEPVQAVAEPRLTILPNLATLAIRGNGATLTIDHGGDA